MEYLTLDAAMLRALELAARGPAYGPNPQVGCVILAPATSPDPTAPRLILAQGWHRGAGTPHAEADALAYAATAGIDVTGATAVVTLEPCNHTGRTGPCARALADGGVTDVVVSVSDPTAIAGGGADYLRSRGVSVTSGLRQDRGEALLRVWLTAVRRGTPYVTLKTATTLDGYVAAVDGSSRWITGAPAREHAHTVRRRVDAIMVGTGTVLTDDPTLTARDASGEPHAHQPLRVVVGRRAVPPGAKVRSGAEYLHLRTHDVAEVLSELAARDIRHVLLEGGPGLATAFLAAHAVDEVHAYLAPMILGEGRRVVGSLGATTLSDAPRLDTVSVERLGDDMLLVARTRPVTAGTPDPSVLT
ncbi:diaminohydroxyphosphoribosylaminopyrimidine deaminase / 5-amino-6-(5-phosphoribosylamino)uracil reductase [Sanguibacter gelidistatuariae]|uniref:Riboflavin biosynthesis protein RibD n=1 Tax=Sanguibacter gelidistatuariae TaxID=1814289 RepID=A0A1G6JLR4_9MICO|nr:bifunctional diaminohydroxyphosphoribosylaminopyrimidine deaminase/5-amino-6-(5-phosphoribosylamino)uracil reductase RibD [Sanguibacter gelidistatuariae]SDC18886.1 diaminohydroxyphosphoribosylaminopyrimidine deaminase / 5-amino-6-(5-phosphoribosylamino)uracil reductase [Sanguibacter gelidistatuariae]